MANIFEQTIVPKIPFSNFDLSETQILTHNFGQLIPCYVREVIPNDIFRLSTFVDVEFAPMVAAMKQDCHVSIHFFYVPNRILFDDFDTFITGAEDGHALTTEAELARMPSQPGLKLTDLLNLADASNHLDPTDHHSDWQGTVLDYFGLPNNLGTDSESELSPSNPANIVISDFVLRGYWKIWYDYYRDENLQVSQKISNTEYTYYEFWRYWKQHSSVMGFNQSVAVVSSLLNNFNPFYRAFKKDYFTGALQSPQKGEPVTISLGTTAPVNIPAQNIQLRAPMPGEANGGIKVVTADSFDSLENSGLYIENSTDQSTNILNLKYSNYDNNVTSIEGVLNKGNNVALTGAYADISKASAITVEALREAFAVQEILESLSLRGSRYVEFLRGNFGVTPDDYKLQRPQFLGGIVSPVAIQKILQTSGYSGADSRDMTGYAAGRAFASAGQNVFSQRFKEHGYIIGIMSVMPKAYYYQGIPKHFMRKDRFDYYMVQTAHLGEQAIENQELYFDPSDSAITDQNQKVFGFIPRWSEYKIAYNGLHGDFRGNLNYYHMARVFDECPTLSEEFISTKDVQTRPFTVWKTENPNINHLIWTSIFFKVTASRPIPYHSLPQIQ